MKKIFLLAFLLWACLAYQNICNAFELPPFRVHFVVSCGEEIIKNRIQSITSRLLREYKDIAIVDDLEIADYWLSISAMRISNSNLISFASNSGSVDRPSSVLVLYKNEFKYINQIPDIRIIMNSPFLKLSEWGSLIGYFPEDNIDKFLRQIVESFDVNIIEPIRKTSDSLK